MKALTISQPYASLIASGEKRFENRTWDCRYRGPLAIHAGKGTQYLDRDELKNYPVSQIIAVCRVVDCINTTVVRTSVHLKWNDGRYSLAEMKAMVADKHFEGPYAIVLADVVKLDEPILIGGKQGLWNVPDELIEHALKQQAAK